MAAGQLHLCSEPKLFFSLAVDDPANGPMWKTSLSCLISLKKTTHTHKTAQSILLPSPCSKSCKKKSSAHASYCLSVCSSVCLCLSVHFAVHLPVRPSVRPYVPPPSPSVCPTFRFLSARSFFFSLPLVQPARTMYWLSFHLDFIFSPLRGSLPWWHHYSFSPTCRVKEHHRTW